MAAIVQKTGHVARARITDTLADTEHYGKLSAAIGQ